MCFPAANDPVGGQRLSESQRSQERRPDPLTARISSLLIQVHIGLRASKIFKTGLKHHHLTSQVECEPTFV